MKRADRFGRALGWFSIGLGLTELLAAPRLTKALGAQGNENIVRAMGARELVHGMLCLSHDKHHGAWSRVGGDAVDLAGLAALYRDDNPKRGVVGAAIAAIVGCTMVDLAAARSLRDLHRRKGPVRDYRDRSGFPRGVDYSRGKASGRIPQDFRATPAAAAASPATGRSSPASANLGLEKSA